MADVELNLESTDSKELLKGGHHAFVTKDYAGAAAALGKATQIMAQEHGDEHDSLGEVYLHYARALLELTRDEAEPLGDAIPQGEEDEDSEEGEGEAEGENGEGEGEENKEEQNEEEKKDEEKATEEEENKETEGVEAKMETEEKPETSTNGTETEAKLTNGHSDHAEAGPSTLNKTEDAIVPTEENAEPSDLQIAWEVLEVAKKIFTARGDNGKELLSQTHILLGEVGMESENFNDAVNDIKIGLEIQESLYEKTNRKLAESYYKLGMAQCTIANFDDAVKCFEKSIEILKGRIELLKTKDDESSKKEIAEMEELLPEIKEKIADMHTVKEETEKVKAEMVEACSNKVEKKEEASPVAKDVKEVKDISHLVKRKRKITDESAECPQPAKKPTP